MPVARARRAAGRLTLYRLAFALADAVRGGEWLVRRRVTILGDTEAGWSMAAATARRVQVVAVGAMSFEPELTMANGKRRRQHR